MLNTMHTLLTLCGGFVLFASLMSDTTEGCSCLARPPHTNTVDGVKLVCQGQNRQEFCGKDFLILARPMYLFKSGGINGKHSYIVHVLRVFKASPKFYQTTEVSYYKLITTGANGALCGVGLTLGRTYLLRGYTNVQFNSKVLENQIALCDQNSLLRHVSKDKQLFLLRDGCRSNTVPYPYCKPANSKNTP